MTWSYFISEQVNPGFVAWNSRPKFRRPKSQLIWLSLNEMSCVSLTSLSLPTIIFTVGPAGLVLSTNQSKPGPSTKWAQIYKT